jgi:hypothetical protein
METQKFFKRVVSAICAAVLGHLGMDVLIHSYPIFGLVWWTRTAFLAAIYIGTSEAEYWYRWANKGNGN